MENELYAKKGYLLEDFRLFHLSGTQGVQAEYHYHEFCKLLLLVSGSGGYCADGQRYGLQSGDVVLLANRCVHRPEFAPDQPYERIILYISPDFLRRNSTADCDLTACFSPAQGHVLRPEGALRQRLHNLALAMERELSGRDYGREILAGGILLRMLVEIGRALQHSQAQRPEPIHPTDERIRGLLAYVDRHIGEELTVDRLAARCYLSKYHMMRLFRAETGQSVTGYITLRRLNLARELIGKGMSATESCFAVGFGSYSSFTRAYHRHFGTTPTGRNMNAREEDFA